MKLLHLGPFATATYRGLTMHAAPGVHSAVASLLHQLEPPPAEVLDAASGDGALTRRLQDLGYGVVGMDVLAPPSTGQPESAPIAVDFDDPGDLEKRSAEFAGHFDAVVSVETIEHVRSPWLFLEFCRSVLRPGGRLILTTPNITSFASRVLFLQSGRFLLFGAENARTMGHINPLPVWELELILSSIGFEEVTFSQAAPVPLVWMYGGIGRSALWSLAMLLALPLYPFMIGLKRGMVLVASARKP